MSDLGLCCVGDCRSAIVATSDRQVQAGDHRDIDDLLLAVPMSTMSLNGVDGSPTVVSTVIDVAPDVIPEARRIRPAVEL